MSKEVDFSLSKAVEKHITEVYRMFSGNKSQTAEALGITRNTLYEKLVQYGIQKTNGKTFKKKGR